MKIGIMGGTFDPIHYGHLILAETAYDRFGMDKVLIMPAGDPYFKVERGVSADEDREAMTRLAIEGNPHFEFSDLELKREGDTYTVDTLKILKEQYPSAVTICSDLRAPQNKICHCFHCFPIYLP